MLGANNPFHSIRAVYYLTSDQADAHADPFDEGGDSGTSMAMLRELIRLHDATTDEVEFMALSNLEWAETSLGWRLWAHHQDLALHDELEIRNLDSLPIQIQRCASSQVTFSFEIISTTGLPGRRGWRKCHCVCKLVGPNTLTSSELVMRRGSRSSWQTVRSPSFFDLTLARVRLCQLRISLKRSHVLGFSEYESLWRS